MLDFIKETKWMLIACIVGALIISSLLPQEIGLPLCILFGGGVGFWFANRKNIL